MCFTEDVSVFSSSGAFLPLKRVITELHDVYMMMCMSKCCRSVI